MSRELIFLVDDNIANLRAGKNVISRHYDVMTMPSAEKMFSLLEQHQPALILLDIDMPGMSGYEAIKLLKSGARTRDIPVIFLTAMAQADDELSGLSLGAVDYITKPWQPDLLLKRLEVHLLIRKQRLELEAQGLQLEQFNRNLQKLVEEKTEMVTKLQSVILKTMAELIECRDNITGRHIENTQHGVTILVNALIKNNVYRDETENWNIDLLLQSSQLHDVGKIAISDTILLKPDKLTEAEFNEIKKHTSFGVAIIEKIESNTPASDFLTYAKTFAGTHHEYWDGGGYPLGLRGMDIPLQGRLLAIADVYDALVSERPYKRAFSHDEAVRIICDSAGTHFDPALIDVFASVKDEFRALAA
ncbi:MAG: response regulator [Spirochaetaceae bacterium]|jgi:putative two-component system response regulator|nr:response regulator [Spirochaetaceae bacterium]